MPLSRTARRWRRRALGTLCVLAAAVVASQVGLSVELEYGNPQWRDPEYGQRVGRLRDRLAEAPDRPMALVLGSSRVAMGVRPAPFDAPEDPAKPRLFNFALVGSGPIMELLCLRRLLADGVRPAELLVEVWPPYLNEEGINNECGRLDVNRLTAADRDWLARYHPEPERLGTDWRAARLAPWFAHRFVLVGRTAPGWLPWYNRADFIWRGIDDYGWLPANFGPGDALSRRVGLANHYAYYGPVFRDFRISPVADRALRDLLDLCRDEHLPIRLLLMPESSEFRGWYSGRVRALCADYLAGLSRRFGVAVIDAHTWMDDADLPDGFHMSRDGAERFTGRLIEEAFAKAPS